MNNATTTKVFCDDCGAECKPEGCTTGYGTGPDGKRRCFDCCAKWEADQMRDAGTAALYLVDDTNGRPDKLTDWPGRLVFPVRWFGIGNHNFGGRRVDVRFTGPAGKAWHGRMVGTNTQVCRCRRSKSA